jgi:hypothetical protein
MLWLERLFWSLTILVLVFWNIQQDSAIADQETAIFAVHYSAVKRDQLLLEALYPLYKLKPAPEANPKDLLKKNPEEREVY